MQRLHVDDMLNDLSVEQWEEWKAFDEVEGIGIRRLYEVLSLVGAAFCHVMGATGVNESFFTPWVPTRENDTEDLLMKARAAAYASEVIANMEKRS